MDGTDLDVLDVHSQIAIDLASIRNELRMMGQLFFRLHANSSLEVETNNGMANFLNRLSERLSLVARRYSNEHGALVRRINLLEESCSAKSEQGSL